MNVTLLAKVMLDGLSTTSHPGHHQQVDDAMSSTTPKPVVYRISEQNEDLDAKMARFQFSNPLGLTLVQEWLLTFYVPPLVGISCLMNVFAIYVLKSHFLRGLVCQPILTSLLSIHILLILCGPLYVWMVQALGIYLTQSNVYPCFLLTWTHNFAMIVSAWMVIMLVVERAVTMGRSELIWDIWQGVVRSILYLLCSSALLIAVLGLLHVDGTVADHNRMYPVCVPWWQNEHRSIGPLWLKLLTIMFSLGPCIVLLMAILMLLIAKARFKLLLRWSENALNHFSALLVDLKASMHFKFVHSALWLGPLLIATCAPLGLFIVFGPTVFVRLHRKTNISDLLYFPEIYPRHLNLSTTHPVPGYHHEGQGQGLTTVSSGIRVHQDQGHPAPKGLGHTFELLSPLEISYLLLSRTDLEASLWLWYYSFVLMVVPILLSTEVLFRREWEGKILKMKRYLLCQGRQPSALTEFPENWDPEGSNRGKGGSTTGNARERKDANQHPKNACNGDLTGPSSPPAKTGEDSESRSNISSVMKPTPLAQMNLSPASLDRHRLRTSTVIM